MKGFHYNLKGHTGQTLFSTTGTPQCHLCLLLVCHAHHWWVLRCQPSPPLPTLPHYRLSATSTHYNELCGVGQTMPQDALLRPRKSQWKVKEWPTARAAVAPLSVRPHQRARRELQPMHRCSKGCTDLRCTPAHTASAYAQRSTSSGAHLP